MGPKYVLILDSYIGCLNTIKLTDEELRKSENYEDFESFLSAIKERYGFGPNNCQWTVAENLSICRYENGKEVKNAQLV